MPLLNTYFPLPLYWPHPPSSPMNCICTLAMMVEGKIWRAMLTKSQLSNYRFALKILLQLQTLRSCLKLPLIELSTLTHFTNFYKLLDMHENILSNNSYQLFPDMLQWVCSSKFIGIIIGKIYSHSKFSVTPLVLEI